MSSINEILEIIGGSRLIEESGDSVLLFSEGACIMWVSEDGSFHGLGQGIFKYAADYLETIKGSDSEYFQSMLAPSDHWIFTETNDNLLFAHAITAGLIKLKPQGESIEEIMNAINGLIDTLRPMYDEYAPSSSNIEDFEEALLQADHFMKVIVDDYIHLNFMARGVSNDLITKVPKESPYMAKNKLAYSRLVNACRNAEYELLVPEETQKSEFLRAVDGFERKGIEEWESIIIADAPSEIQALTKVQNLEGWRILYRGATETVEQELSTLRSKNRVVCGNISRVSEYLELCKQ